MNNELIKTQIKTKLPKGFRTSGINAGIRKYRPDLGVVISEVPAKMSAVYTTNCAKAAHIQYCQQILPSEDMRGIITNSGQANSATGKQGLIDNQKMIDAFAKEMDFQPNQIASASTGVIGVPVEIEKIQRAMPDLLMRTSEHAEAFATAIMTTDLVPKTVCVDIKLSQGNVRLTGICKGSGMIHPNMATMLGYFLTDLNLELETNIKLLKAVTEKSFNMISVDGETSTNDTCFFMSNGASEVSLVTDEDRKVFANAMEKVAIHMAKSIAADGEGASKLIEARVSGIEDQAILNRAAKGIVLSPLIKTAIHGEDPNWGRIYSRLGQDGIEQRHLDNMDLKIQGISILENGQSIPFDYYQIRSAMAQDTIVIDIDFKQSKMFATSWGCDLTKKYVDINTEYN